MEGGRGVSWEPPQPACSGLSWAQVSAGEGQTKGPTGPCEMGHSSWACLVAGLIDQFGEGCHPLNNIVFSFLNLGCLSIYLVFKYFFNNVLWFSA